jgi:hypothetical protein
LAGALSPRKLFARHGRGNAGVLSIIDLPHQQVDKNHAGPFRH